MKKSIADSLPLYLTITIRYDLFLCITILHTENTIRKYQDQDFSYTKENLTNSFLPNCWGYVFAQIGKKMTKKKFFKAVSNGRIDVLQIFLDTIINLDVDYCVIGGLAVNAYAEPVVNLDLAIVVIAEDIDGVCNALGKFFKVEQFAHSVNLNSSKSDLRIQLQTDSRYQEFILRATTEEQTPKGSGRHITPN